MLNTLNLRANAKRDFRFVDPEASKRTRNVKSSKSSSQEQDTSLVPDWARNDPLSHGWSSSGAVQTNVNILAVANENFRKQQIMSLKSAGNSSHTRTLRSHREVRELVAESTVAVREFPFDKVKETPPPAPKKAKVDYSFHPEDFTASVGVFSDTRSYSALIKNELHQYQVNLKHFHHPNTFESERFEYFDKIEAWLLFLSEDCNEEFIDRFIDRYADKPALFLCPKMRRQTASEKIASFLRANELGS